MYYRVQIPWGKGEFLGLSGEMKSIASHCCNVCSKKSITASARLLQPFALLPTGRCHINFPPKKNPPPEMQPLIKIRQPLVNYTIYANAQYMKLQYYTSH